MRMLLARSGWISSPLDLELRRAPIPSGLTVSVYVASLNTAASTELCIRTMRQFACYPFNLTVGDCGSVDGSIAMLKDLQAKSWLRLEVAPEGRKHAAWLDHWRAQCTTDLAVFVDSDVEFRAAGWLSDLVRAASVRQAALVCGELIPEQPFAVEPVGGRTVRGRPLASPWLFVIDVKKTAGIRAGFGFRAEETDAVPEGLAIWDTGGWFFEQLSAAGLNWVAMPYTYRRKYHHYGGLSWISLEGKRGRKKQKDLRVIDKRLRYARQTRKPEMWHV